MANFVQEMGLISVWDNHPVVYTHIHTDWKSKSVLDHFLLSPRLLPLVEGCGIVERGDNRSRHCPIWLKIKLGSLPIRKPCSKWIPRKPAWSRATTDQKSAYRQQLENRLEQLQAAEHPQLESSLKCQDLHCKDILHSEARDNHVLDLLTAVIEASHGTMPMYGGCRVGDKRPGVGIPGWNNEVRPYRDDSLYWGNIWRQHGRPESGWIHQNFVEARRQYHRAVLRVKRMRKHHQAEELLVAAMEGDVQLLKEMKTIKQGRHAGNSELPDCVGGAEGEEAIAEMFRQSYETLYNSASSANEMDVLKTTLERLMGVHETQEVSKVTGAVIKEAVGKLKPGKADVSGG